MKRHWMSDEKERDSVFLMDIVSMTKTCINRGT